ncbi:TonB-dependent receptor plug domain-containing protein [Alteromonas sp. ASW11-130]|uniref:TonB-dependent receptor plug domain-containing protein n=1 Tax=Alteromonas sp. ASW11-130 TaxID=3015775 RepID=UPI0022421F86|nr:TonB-dependent receptor [Alteromonas sp. ASW11-130]MCW8090525.1 TonB-dependent receptor [Alteromonas sp. ASW11-130]
MYLFTHKPSLLIGGLITATQFISYLSHAAEDVETITIKGSRLPLHVREAPTSLTVIGEEEIQQSGASQLTDILRGLPGIAISTSGTMGALTEIRVRGSESNHLLLVVDGVVLNDDSQGGLIDLAHISVKDVKKIELLRGPQAAAWGSGAVGGVLHITTFGKHNDIDPFYVSVGVGNKNTHQVVTRVSDKTNFTRYSIALQHVESNGDNISRAGSEDDGYKRSIVNAHYQYQKNEWTTNTSIRLTDLRTEYDSVDYAQTGLPVDADNFTEGKKASANVSVTYSPHKASYATTLMGMYSKHTNENVESGEFISSAMSERFQLTNTHSLTWNNIHAIVGAEYLQRLYTQQGIVAYSDPNQRQDDQTLSAFFETQTELTNSVNFTLGTRFDDNSEFDNAVSYRSGFSWHIDRHYTAFISLGKAIKNPTFTERFGYYPATFIGNPHLQPEHSQEWELGLRAHFSSSLYGQVSVYEAELKDEILGFVFDSTSGLMTAENAVSMSNRSGLDSELSWFWGGLKWRASYSYLNATEDPDVQDKVEFRRPRHSGGLSISGALTDKLSAYLKWTYTGSQTDAYFHPPLFAPDIVSLRPYSLLSVNMGYDLTPSWRTSVRVQNALNQDYEDIVGFAGETLSVLLTLSYNIAE